MVPARGVTGASGRHSHASGFYRVPYQPTTIFEELGAAARGSVALIVGDRSAPQYFDFSLRGLAGSFIAFLVAIAFSAYLPVLTGAGDPEGSIARLLLMVVLLFGIQIGCAALVLRQLKRLDGLVPYLVADNWATFFLTAISSLMAVTGLNGELALLVIGVGALVVEINISRLIVTLTPWQIVMFLAAQTFGVLVWLVAVGLSFPIPASVATAGATP